MMIWPFIKMLVIAGSLFIVLLFTMKLLKKGKIVSSSSSQLIKILTTQWIAPQKYISIVEIGGELFALGISESQINLLTKIEDRELAKRIVESQESKTPHLYNTIQNYIFKNRGFSGIFFRRLNEK